MLVFSIVSYGPRIIERRCWLWITKIYREQLLDRIRDLETLNNELLKVKSKKPDSSTLGQAILGIGIGTLRPTK